MRSTPTTPLVKPHALPYARRLRAFGPLALFAALHMVVLSTASPSFAQSRPAAAPATREDLVQRGQRLFDEQQYEDSIQVLSAALVRPSNTKDQKIEILRLLALDDITLGKKEEAEAYFRALLALSPDYELSSKESPRFRDFFKSTKEKWIADGRPGVVKESEPLPVPVTMQHNSPSQVDPHTQIDLTVKLDDPTNRVDTLKLFYRAGTKDKYTEVLATMDEGSARASIPPIAVKPPFIEYYFLGYDKNNVPIVSRGDVSAPLRIAVPEPSKGWVLPAAIGGGALVVAAAIVGGILIFGKSSSSGGGGPTKPGQSTVSIGIVEQGRAGFSFGR
jgi:tetratricopeptide (TPR) repeat protein